MSARNGWLGASVAVAIVAASALVLFGVAMREASSEHVDEWRMQAMSTRQAQALWRLRIAETFGNDAARLALAQVLVSDADPQRVRRGVALLRRVADGGDARAQLQLGKILLKGLPGVGVDHTESREWLLKAAAAATRHAANTGEESPDPDNAPAGFAAFYLASIYRNGYGVAPDPPLNGSNGPRMRAYRKRSSSSPTSTGRTASCGATTRARFTGSFSPERPNWRKPTWRSPSPIEMENSA
jgi:hypothetical protein